MIGKKRSKSATAGAASTSATPARVWRFQRTNHDTLDSFYDAVMRAQANGRAEYWRHVVVVKTDEIVHLQCKLCDKQLSAKNSADSAGQHIVTLPDGTTTCKEAKSRQEAVRSNCQSGSQSS
jgi:hypothetical protein